MHFFRMFLHPLDISPELLKESTLYLGYNPRRCFYSASSMERLEELKGVIKSDGFACAGNSIVGAMSVESAGVGCPAGLVKYIGKGHGPPPSPHSPPRVPRASAPSTADPPSNLQRFSNCQPGSPS